MNHDLLDYKDLAGRTVHSCKDLPETAGSNEVSALPFGDLNFLLKRAEKYHHSHPFFSLSLTLKLVYNDSYCSTATD